MTFDEIVASLRQSEGLRNKGKRHPNFHFRSKPFLHFHNGPDGPYADVSFGGRRINAEEREALLEQVKAHVTAELASRRRTRG